MDSNNEGLARNVVNKILGTRFKREDYEDAMQEARFAIMMAQRSFKPELGVPWMSYAWLCAERRVCKWKAKHLDRGFTKVPSELYLELASLETFKTDSEQHNQTLKDLVPAPHNDCLEQLATKELGMRAEQRLSKLKPQYATALRMHTMEGLTYEQIGTRLGVSRARIGIVVQTARELLVNMGV